MEEKKIRRFIIKKSKGKFKRLVDLDKIENWSKEELHRLAIKLFDDALKSEMVIIDEKPKTKTKKRA